MSSDSRSRIMARVRRGSRGARGTQVGSELESLGRAPSAPLPCEDVCTAFLVNVLRNHGSIDVAADRGAAVKTVGSYVYRHYRSHRLVAGNDPHLAAMPWRDGGVLPRFGRLEPGEPVALSYARWGVAESGAIVTLTGKSNPVANNLLPERHIVILDSRQVVADMEALWQQVNPCLDRDGRPRGIHIIAGPSSTADIEGQLVWGAHGPRAWHVILMGDTPVGVLESARALAGR